MDLNLKFESKVMAVWICLEIPCLILSVSVYYEAQLDIWVKSYGHLNLSGSSVLNFKHFNILWASIKHLSKKLWSFWLSQYIMFNFDCLSSASFDNDYQIIQKQIKLGNYVEQD